MSRARPLNLLLASLLFASLLPVGLADSDPATDAQEAAIRALLVGNSGPKGNGQIQADWETRNELHTLYLRAGETLTYSRPPGGNNNPSFHLLYDPATANSGPAGMDPDQDLVLALDTAGADTELSYMSVALPLAANTAFSVEATLEADGEEVAQVVVDMGDVVGGQPTLPGFGSPVLAPPLYNAFAFFNPPAVIPAGSDITLRLHAVVTEQNTLDTLELWYNHIDDAPARAVFAADTARVATWTEKADKAFAEGFPTAAGASTTQRTMLLRVAHVNGFGDIATALEEPSTGNPAHYISIVGPDGKVYFDNRATILGATTVDAALNQRWGASVPYPGDATGAGDGLVFSTYSLTYPPTLTLEGTYTIQVRARAQNWKVEHEIVVGGAGTNLERSPFEQTSTKDILIGEQTNFRIVVTNTGGARDTLALNAAMDSTPTGWSASVNPSAVTLNAGESTEAVVSIVPSPQGRDGDLNRATVTATSLLSGRSSDPLVLTVRLSDDPTFGVQVLTQSANAEVGPGATKQIPIAVANTGNARDQFVVSLQGAPTGWTVGLTPGTLDLEAKTIASPILTVRAPTDAARGTSFPLTIKAVRVDDSTVQNVRVLNVAVFLEDKLRFEVFGGSDAVGDPIGIATSSLDAPIVHFLRDEGPDASTGPASVTTPGGVLVLPASCSGTTDPGVAGTADCTAPGTFWDGDNGNPGDGNAGNGDPDRDYDQSTLFRLMLVNDGDRDDQVRLLPNLVTAGSTGPNAALRSLGYQSLGTTAQRTALGAQDIDGCEEPQNNNDGGAGDGMNDGWRFRLFDPAAATIPALPSLTEGGEQSYAAVAAYGTTVTVPAHSTKYVYAEFVVINIDPILNGVISELCDDPANRVQGTGTGTRPGDSAPGHAVAIEAVSGNDPAQRILHVLNAKVVGSAAPGTAPTRLGSQHYSDQQSGVSLELEMGGPAARIVQKEASETVRTATYPMRIVNTGNEMDTLRVSFPQLQNGWEHRVSGLPAAASPLLSNNLIHGMKNNPVAGTPGRIAGCTTPSVVSGVVSFDCIMGSQDEVAFNVLSIAPIDGTLGTSDALTVTATSRDSFLGGATGNAPIVSDAVALTTRLTGAYVFDLLPNTQTVNLQVYPGGSIAAPWTLRNLGTQEDNINFDLSIAPDTDSGWSADFSQGNPVFLPPESDVNGFLAIRAPATAQAGDQERFRIRATSGQAPGTPPIDIMDVLATVVAEPAAFEIAGDPADVVAQPGATADLTVRATRATGNTATGVTFRLDATTLPVGWTTTSTTPVPASYDTNGRATAVFHVTSPADSLGTSRASVRVTGTDTANILKFTEVGVSLSSPSVGVELNSTTGDTLEVVSGTTGSTVLQVKNLGAGVDAAAMSLVGTVPTGWAVSFDPSTVQLQPLETRNVTLSITVPPGLEPGEQRLLRIQATSTDPTRFDVFELTVATGTSVPELTPKVNGTLHQLPEEPFRFAVSVGNNGTIGDDLDIVPTLGVFEDIIEVTVTPDQVSVEPGQAQDVLVEVTLPKGLVPGTEIPLTIEARSVGPFLAAVGTTTVEIAILNHTVRDVDGDAIEEYAVDRNLDDADGYEAFRDPSEDGVATSLLDMASFLDEEGVEDHTVSIPQEDGNTTDVLLFRFDGDGDGLTDLMLDTGQDDKPDIYWDPDRDHSAPIPLAKDVTRDGVREFFIDLDGQGAQLLDAYYDPAAGEFGDLIQVDIDSSGDFDYVVDLNGNGRVDLNEPVLFGGPDGEVVRITERRDVDGDGHLDTVVDTDADGDPDFFIPNGRSTGVPITLEDVNGDGTDDWTYDSDGDGTRDSYYDPVANEVGQINPGNAFLNDLKDYFYIPVLFGLVLVLFVVLVAVTRK